MHDEVKATTGGEVLRGSTPFFHIKNSMHIHASSTPSSTYITLFICFWRRHEWRQRCDICVYPTFGFCFFPGVFLSSRVTEACPVTTDLVMLVNVRTTTIAVVGIAAAVYDVCEIAKASCRRLLLIMENCRYKKNRFFTGRAKSRGSCRVGSGQLTRPDP